MQDESSLRRRGQENPFGLFQLASHVLRFGPCKTVVLGTHHEELGALADFVSRFGAVVAPLMFSGLVPHPDRGAENLAGVLIYQDARIAAAVLFLR